MKKHSHSTPKRITVRKTEIGYIAESEDRKRLPGGPYFTREAAEKRCAQVNQMMSKGH